ncbi:lysophospholipid acyltransferase family protein [Halioxenophilus sp. WMMB6]|uniref:lysophospholipid acyltransferase family protein n=1 Tax=Halioxenophilus sp. WMMB6 TaxID=3073815 RepID=UPI00295F20E4|nr:lysophospholipid acyltransferase family protein [Halioxenophilus sp. WMMB6]
MIDTPRSMTGKFPAFDFPGAIFRKPTQKFLRKITHESELADILTTRAGLGSLDFIDQIFEQLNFTYQVSARDRQNIPDEGRVLVYANQPLASLHALALVRLVAEVRKDIRLVIDEQESEFGALGSLIIQSGPNAEEAIQQALAAEQAVILFPTGNFAKVRPQNRSWRSDLLHYCRATKTPLLPVLVQVQKSWRTLSSGLVPTSLKNLLAQAKQPLASMVKINVGELIAPGALQSGQLNDRALLQRLKKHIHKLRKNHKSPFETLKTIAHPEDRCELRKDLKQADLLGETRDNQGIYLVEYQCDTLMREIGRLREFTFRKVGEGTGSKRDLDNYDRHYQHLVLWNHEQLEVAGAYRLGHVASILQDQGIDGLYTSSLFNFTDHFLPLLPQAVELGRSFVNPKFWGKNSLDYLWQGIGAYFRHHPDVRYVFGPVTISADYPKHLTEEMVFFYEHFYSHGAPLAEGRLPFTLPHHRQQALQVKYGQHDKESGFKLLQAEFAELGYKVPVLFKQYAALYEEGGFQLLGFNIDPDFANCIDGLFIADLNQLKANKRKRYLGDEATVNAAG